MRAFLYMTNFQIYGKLLSWQKARFSGPPKMAIFRIPKIGYFGDHQKRPIFRVLQKRGRFLRPEKDRFLGPGNKACFWHRRH